MTEVQMEELLRVLVQATKNNETTWRHNFESDKDWCRGGLRAIASYDGYLYALHFKISANPVKTLKYELIARTPEQTLFITALSGENKFKLRNSAACVTIIRFNETHVALINTLAIEILSKSGNDANMPFGAA